MEEQAVKNTPSQHTILIIDDEPNVVAYLEMFLQDQGYNTVSAENGLEGMACIEQSPPDLICLDITMPEQSGIRFYRNLREDPDLAHIPVLVVTAVTGYGGDPEPFKKFISSRKNLSPPEGFFSKPIDREVFIRRVRELLP